MSGGAVWHTSVALASCEPPGSGFGHWVGLSSSHFCPLVNLWLQAKLFAFRALVSSL